MKVKRICDICGDDVHLLHTLNSYYVTEDIEYICDSCFEELSDKHYKITEKACNIRNSLFKRAISKLKEKKQK